MSEKKEYEIGIDRSNGKDESCVTFVKKVGKDEFEIIELLRGKEADDFIKNFLATKKYVHRRKDCGSFLRKDYSCTKCEKFERKELDQSVFCGQSKHVDYAQVSQDGELVNLWNNKGCLINQLEMQNFKPGMNLKREYTSDGMTFDEALECRKLQYHYKPNDSWNESISFRHDWKEGICHRNLKLSQYRKKPEEKSEIQMNIQQITDACAIINKALTDCAFTFGEAYSKVLDKLKEKE